jgi:hypothetical protein
MKHVHKELSPEDRAWVKAEISTSNAMLAVADARRQAAQAEQRATLQLLAMERERADMAKAYGLPVPDSAVATGAGAVAGAPSADAPQAPAVPGAVAPVALPAGVPTQDLAAIVAAVLAAQGGAVAPADSADATPDAEIIEDQDQDGESLLSSPLEPPTLSNLSKADAIRIALRKRPELQPAQISELLAGYDVQVSADYVRQIRNRDQDERTAAELGDASGEVVPIRKEA